MLTFIPFIVGVLLLTILEGFFAGSELAIVSIDRVFLKREIRRGNRGAELALQFLDYPERLFGTTLLGTNLCAIANSTLVTIFVTEIYGVTRAYYAAFLIPCWILIFAEIIPKGIFREKAELLVPKLVYPLWFFQRLFYPAVWLMNHYASFLREIFHVEKTKKWITREELRWVLRKAKGEIKQFEKDLIHKIFDFSRKVAREAMVPLIDLVALEENEPLSKMVAIMNQTGHTRIPIYSKRIDKIVGIVQAFDILFEESLNRTVKEFAQPAHFVPETQRIDRLLLQMQRQGLPMVVMVDEYGGAVGVITVDDILEEVVGEIEDEYDVPALLYRRLDQQNYLVSARMDIETFNNLFKVTLPKGSFDTLGGFLLDRLGKIPRVGEEFHFEDIVFTIHKSTERSIELISIKFGKPIEDIGS